MQDIKRVIGQIKGGEFQIGVRRTLGIGLTQAWRFLLSDEGLRVWLGDVQAEQMMVGTQYRTSDGKVGEIRVINPEVNIRLTWQPPTWQKKTTVQVRTIAQGRNTVISFHQEGLPGANEREEMRVHWQRVLDKLQSQIEANRHPAL